MISVTCLNCEKKFEAERKSAKFCNDVFRATFAKLEEKEKREKELKWLAPNENSKEEIPSEIPPLEKTVAPTGKVSGNLDKLKALRETIAKIDKDYGVGSVMCMGEQSAQEIETTPTGSLGLDLALGVGGLPKGRIVEIYGPESSGKTTLATHIIAEAQKMGGYCAMIDVEHAFDVEYAEKLGVNTDLLYISQPDTGEQALEMADRLICSGSVSVLVIDSVAALVPKAELEAEIGDNKMGAVARLMSQACRKLTGSVSRSNTVCIFINQLREKIGVMFGSPEVTTGGNALKFYASVRLDVRRSAQIKDGEEVVGNRVKVKVVKNKVASPFKSAEFDIIFGEGISKMGEIIDKGVELAIINKSGSWYNYGEIKLGQGRESAKELLRDHPEMAIEIENKITNQ